MKIFHSEGPAQVGVQSYGYYGAHSTSPRKHSLKKLYTLQTLWCQRSGEAESLSAASYKHFLFFLRNSTLCAPFLANSHRTDTFWAYQFIIWATLKVLSEFGIWRGAASGSLALQIGFLRFPRLVNSLDYMYIPNSILALYSNVYSCNKDPHEEISKVKLRKR